MKKFPIFLLLVAIIAIVTSCDNDKSVWDRYEGNRNANLMWLMDQMDRLDANGKPYYTMLRAPWDKNAFVLIRYLNDTTLTQNNLRPFYTSTIAVKYKLSLYNGKDVDSSYVNTDSLATFRLSEVIDGWAIALTNMHKGDSCEFIVPYPQGYGASETTSGILPYSALKFNVKLVDIPGWEIP